MRIVFGSLLLFCALVIAENQCLGAGAQAAARGGSTKAASMLRDMHTR